MSGLKFSDSNSKTVELERRLEGRVVSLSLLAGWACPGASECLARVVECNGRKRLVDGPKQKFRCFSASQEVQYPSVYEQRKHNFDTLMQLRHSRASMRDAILDGVESMESPRRQRLAAVRIHVSGDFFSYKYLQAWADAAANREDLIFYGYTKSIHHMVKFMSEYHVPPNFRIVGSVGGKYDALLPEFVRLGGITAEVFTSHDEASEAGYEVDHDDSHAALYVESFALVVHGPQAAGSAAGKAVARMRKAGEFSGYSRDKKVA